MVLLLIPLLIGMMWAIGQHYRSVERELASRLDWPIAAPPGRRGSSSRSAASTGPLSRLSPTPIDLHRRDRRPRGGRRADMEEMRAALGGWGVRSSW